MGNIFVVVFSTTTGPVAQCLGYYFRSGSLSVSPFRFLAESYWLSPYKIYFSFYEYIISYFLIKVKFFKWRQIEVSIPIRLITVPSVFKTRPKAASVNLAYEM